MQCSRTGCPNCSPRIECELDIIINISWSKHKLKLFASTFNWPPLRLLCSHYGRGSTFIINHHWHIAWLIIWQHENCLWWLTNWVITSFTANSAITTTRAFWKMDLNNVSRTSNSKNRFYFSLTINAGNFGPQAIRDALRIGRITVGDACEGFFDAKIRTKFVKFKFPKN